MQTEQNGIQGPAEVFTGTTQSGDGSFSVDHFIDQVAIEDLEDRLNICIPVLEKALAKTDDYTMQDLVDKLYRNEAALLIEFADNRPQGCAIVCSVPYAAGKAFHIMAIAGFPGKTRLYPNADSLKLLKTHAWIWGCNCVQGFCQEAVARLWSRAQFQEVYRLMRIEL